MHKMNQAPCQLIAWPGFCCSLQGTPISLGMKMWGCGKFPHPLLATPEKASLGHQLRTSPVPAQHRWRDRNLLTFLCTVSLFSSEASELQEAHICLGMTLLSS